MIQVRLMNDFSVRFCFVYSCNNLHVMHLPNWPKREKLIFGLFKSSKYKIYVLVH